MPRLGREYEKFVALLERSLGSNGIEVKSPEYITGKSGIPYEIDVTIRGKIQNGSLDFLGLMHCRERGKKADFKWIMQIHDEKEDTHANFAIAVSSSGFSKEAVKYAKEKGIILRKLSKVNQAEIDDFLRTTRVAADLHKITYRHMGLLIGVSNIGMINVELPSVMYNGAPAFNALAPAFPRKSDGTLVSLNDIWNLGPRDDIYKICVPNGPKITVTINLKSSDLEETYQIITSAGKFDINSFEITGDIWLVRVDNPIKNLYRYKDVIGTEKLIAETAIYEINDYDTDSVIRCYLDTATKKLQVEVIPDTHLITHDINVQKL